MRHLLGSVLIAAAALVSGNPALGQVQVDPKIPSYEKMAGVSGNLSSVGSDTLNNLMALWAEGFRKQYPNVRIQVEGKGSATAPPALIEGTAQLGPMSREMKPEEIDSFQEKYGYKPTQISVAIDCLAVLVHRDNPVKGLTLAQIDCIFSKTRKSGFRDISTWGQAGLKNDANWAEVPISIYGRNSASGTYAFFKEHALGKGDFKDSVKEQPGSAAVVDAVSGDRAGIGYSGIGYMTSNVRALPLARDPQSPLAQPSFENAISGKYPLGRQLYVYVNKKPNEPLPTLVAEFVKYILSREGQEVVVKDGYGPLPGEVAAAELKELQ